MTDRKAQTAAAIEARKLPAGNRYTRTMRFTLTNELADEFEAMTKEQRDKVVTLGIKMSRSHRRRSVTDRPEGTD